MLPEWRDAEGKLKVEYKFHYDQELATKFLETLRSLQDKRDFMRCLKDTYYIDQVTRFYARESSFRSELSDDENRAAAEKAMASARPLKPRYGFQEWLELRFAQLSREQFGEVTKDSSIGFESFLTESGRKILPQLIKEYSSAKPKKICLLVKSLMNQKLLVSGADRNKTVLHKALTKKLGNIGSPQSFNYNMNINHTDADLREFNSRIKTLLNSCEVP
jgi:hypothetical protein